MGRSKKRSRASKARLNPLNNNDDASGVKDASLVTKKIQPLLKQLQSAVPNERNMAISSISVLCEDTHMRQLLLREKLVQVILSNLLNDDNKDIVIEAYGLLRNLTLEEGYDVSIFLWRSNIWTSIKDGFKQVSTSLDALKSTAGNSTTDRKQIAQQNQSKRMLFDFADNLISLLVSLTNDTDDILNEILEEKNLEIIFDLVIKFIDYGLDNLPTALTNTILDLIYDFSSESLDFIDILLKCQPIISLIESLRTNTPENELTQILTQGIIVQLLDADEESKLDSTQCTQLFQNIMKAIQNIDLATMRLDLISIITDEADIPKLKEEAKKRQLAMMQLQAVEIGLDVIAGIIEMIASLNVEVTDELGAILTGQVPHFFNSLLVEFPDRILIAWNNLLWLFVSMNQSLDNVIVKKLWDDVTLFEDKADIPIKMGKMSVMWVILKMCGVQGNVELLNEFKVWNNLEFVDTIIEQYNQVEEIEFRQRCCALLTTVACYQGQNVQVNQKIGQFFIELLVVNSTQVEILVEVTSALFEVYSDSNFDYDLPVFVEGGFLQILKDKVLPNLKNTFKMIDKNKNPGLKQKCTDIFSTLGNFINYKETERS